MTTEPIKPGTPSLVQRVKDILISPKATWERIDGEPATIKSLYLGYVLILAAIGPLALFVGGQVFGHGAFGITYRPTFAAGLSTALVSYLLSLAGVFVLALIIDALAPTFGGARNRVQALKVAAYGSTAAWLAGIFQLVPALAILGLLGLYSLYLIYLGLPRLMKSPQEKALPYTAVAVVVAIVLWIVIGALTTAIVTATAGSVGGPFTDRGSVRGSVTVPGGGRVDLGEMERAARAAEEAMADPDSVRIIPASDLQGMMPAMVANLPRTSVSSTSGGMGGISGSAAEAVYERDDARISLVVTDLGAMGGLAAMGGAFNVESNRESEGSYERIGRVDGRMTSESYDRNARRGDYSVLVGNRVLVAAEGSNVTMDQLKAAVASINAARLEGMVRN